MTDPSPVLMRDYSLYVLYRAAIALLSVLPLSFVFRLGRFGGWCCWLLLARYRRLALRNLEIAFGDSKPRIRASPHRARTFSAARRKHSKQSQARHDAGRGNRKTRSESRTLELIHKYLRAGDRSFASGASRQLGIVRAAVPEIHRLHPQRHDLSATAQSPHRPASPRPCAPAPAWKCSTGMKVSSGPIKLLRDGGIIGILCDQHAGDKGIWVPFFNKLASTTPLPALLAKRTDAVLIAVAFHTDGPARWRLAIGPVIEPQKNQSIGDLTSRSMTSWRNRSSRPRRLVLGS